MSKGQLKPTFITLGHITIRRVHFSGLVRRDNSVGVLIGKDNPYTEWVNDEEKTKSIMEDFNELKENNMI